MREYTLSMSHGIFGIFSTSISIYPPSEAPVGMAPGRSEPMQIMHPDKKKRVLPLPSSGLERCSCRLKSSAPNQAEDSNICQTSS